MMKLVHVFFRTCSLLILVDNCSISDASSETIDTTLVLIPENKKHNHNIVFPYYELLSSIYFIPQDKPLLFIPSESFLCNSMCTSFKISPQQTLHLITKGASGDGTLASGIYIHCVAAEFSLPSSHFWPTLRRGVLFTEGVFLNLEFA